MRLADFYTRTSSELFHKGRPGDPRVGEWVKAASLSRPPYPRPQDIVLWGCPDDLGVTLNRGRAGAKEGPDSIRKHLYKMTLPMDQNWEKHFQFWDLGNLIAAQTLLVTQERCEAVVAGALANGEVTIVCLGGGHDFAAPNFKGYAKGLQTKKAIKLGLLNVDPHLDVRPLENGQPHSGTPFRQLLEAGTVLGKNFSQFGTRANRNATDHFAFCKQKGVAIHSLELIRASASPAQSLFRKLLRSLTSRCNRVGVTIDMDSCSDGEGTSAAPVIGFSAQELVHFASCAGSEKKVSYFEIAEVAPSLDEKERTSRIAAEMIFAFLRARVSEKKSK